MDEKTPEERIAALEQEVKALRAACEAAGALTLVSASPRRFPKPPPIEIAIGGTAAIRAALA